MTDRSFLLMFRGPSGLFGHREIANGQGEKLVSRVTVVEQRSPVDGDDLQVVVDPHGAAVLLEHPAKVGLRIRPSILDLRLRHRQDPHYCRSRCPAPPNSWM